MRPITPGEKNRIKDQSLTRIYGLSEIAFEVEYFNYEPIGDPEGSPVSYVWWEEGFYGDFSFGGREVNVASSTTYDVARLFEPGWRVKGALNGLSQSYTSKMLVGASITLPIEYHEGFYTRGGYGTRGHNRLFRFEQSHDLFKVEDTVYCNRVWIKSLHGEPMPADFPNVFKIDPTVLDGGGFITDEGTLTLDGWSIPLVADSYKGSYSSLGVHGAGGITYPRGSGVVDATGRLSERKDRKFEYVTTPDMRRTKW